MTSIVSEQQTAATIRLPSRGRGRPSAKGDAKFEAGLIRFAEQIQLCSRGGLGHWGFRRTRFDRFCVGEPTVDDGPHKCKVGPDVVRDALSAPKRCRRVKRGHEIPAPPLVGRAS